MAKPKRWAVGSIIPGQSMIKRVFNTYEGALRYVDDLNKSRLCSLVVLQDNEYFREF